MAEKITKKKYYRIILSLDSPLAIGSGENVHSDRDIIRDSCGDPYIPATAIAGVCRSNFQNDDQEREYFGYVLSSGSSRSEHSEDLEETIQNQESRIIFYDAVMLSEYRSVYRTTIRDSVKLDAYKTAVAGAKFDMEVLEPGVRFRTYIEQNFYKNANEDYGEKIIQKLLEGLNAFGGKTTRGYGTFEFIEILSAEFSLKDFCSADDLNEWLQFDLYNDKVWEDGLENGTVQRFPLERIKPKMLMLELKQKGGIAIRKYTTEVISSNVSAPDFEQLTVHRVETETAEDDSTDSKPTVREVPVIPGTTWAGAIRHRMHDLGLSADEEKSLFGCVIEENKEKNIKAEKIKSKIYFQESYLEGGVFKELSRNAIDRLTGGTVDGALFTERTYYNGTTQLCIAMNPSESLQLGECSILAAALADLHYGFLAVGGETSIGRGLFEITGINGISLEDTSEDAVYGILLEQIRKLWSTTEEVSA